MLSSVCSLIAVSFVSHAATEQNGIEIENVEIQSAAANNVIDLGEVLTGVFIDGVEINFNSEVLAFVDFYDFFEKH